MVLGKNRIAPRPVPSAHMSLIITAGEKMGQGVGVATVLGAPPELTIASQVIAPMGVDETEVAGAFRGEPLEVVRCETIDVEVPANAEIVIEGVTIPGERVDDGPFGEYPGNYISLGNYHSLSHRPFSPVYVVQVTAITMRKDPIFQALLTGMPTTENHLLKKWSLAATIYDIITRELVPRPDDIRGINLTLGGGSDSHAIISIRKRSESTARDIIYTVLSMRIVVGMVTVVDEDIDIYNPSDVEWAVATRVRPTRDIIILPMVPSKNPLAPPVHIHRWGIDATKPLGETRSLYDRAVPPGVDKVDYV
ncbi:Phenolic acid decarboxylase [subsurface metagenome]